MLGNRQHMFLIPYWVQITPHYTCLDSLYAIAPNQIYDFSTVNKNKKQQFPKEIYGKKSNQPVCQGSKQHMGHLTLYPGRLNLCL